jgi:cellulose synthase/poly-beta-1,6-N-acetylglucosamine synthase-like glycosyltransferase
MKFILSFCLVYSAFSCFASNPSLSTQKIKGYLVDFRTKSDVDEVQVELVSLGTGKRFKTETKNGVFIFRHVPIGKQVLLLVDKNYLRDTLAIFETNRKKHLQHYTFSEAEPFTARLKVTWFFNWGDRTFTRKNGTKYTIEHYWSHLLAKIILIVYGLCLIMIFYYSVVQLTLALNYRKSKKKGTAPSPSFDVQNAPKVTVQLPMYNEMYVAERIIDTVAKFNYPRDKFQIQVLDDSTDETKDIIARKVQEIAAKGINIQHVHRVDRTGYKAGALDAAMDQVEGEFIAIFDADFVPDEDFLVRTIPYFNEEYIGVVQTRWGHLNKSYSLLTELQAFGLNGHFAIEQQGRNVSGHYINFNGTAGIWRKACIEDAGGWEHDTITEDLDLSYRAQMKGWKFKYLEDVESPAELPITMSALKSQQHRWMKGGAEVFIKIRKRLIGQKGIRFSDRLHGLAHLFNSSVFVFILILSLLSLPILHIKDSFADLNFFVQFGAFFISSSVFLAFYYWNSFRDKTGHFLKDLFRFIIRFIQFLSVSMALSLSNAVAVIEGYLRIKSSFVRTPKFNVAQKNEFSGNHYDKKSLSILNIAEGLLMTVFAFTAVNRLVYGDLGMVPFHLMLAVGYGVVFFSTLKEVRQGK